MSSFFAVVVCCVCVWIHETTELENTGCCCYCLIGCCCWAVFVVVSLFCSTWFHSFCVLEQASPTLSSSSPLHSFSACHPAQGRPGERQRGWICTLPKPLPSREQQQIRMQSKHCWAGLCKSTLTVTVHTREKSRKQTRTTQLRRLCMRTAPSNTCFSTRSKAACFLQATSHPMRGSSSQAWISGVAPGHRQPYRTSSL